MYTFAATPYCPLLPAQANLVDKSRLRDLDHPYLRNGPCRTPYFAFQWDAYPRLLTVSQHALGRGVCVSQHALSRGGVYPSLH